MSRHAPRRPRNRVDESAIQEIHIPPEASESHTAPSPSVGPRTETVSDDLVTADRRRIYRENVPVRNPATAPAAPIAEFSSVVPSVDAAPLTYASIPEWAPFFREGMGGDVNDDCVPVMEEHARRYINSVQHVISSSA